MKDRGFCTPVIDEEEAAAKKKKEEMDREIELIKKEYDDKMKKKKSKVKDKSKEVVEDEKAEREKDAKVDSLYSIVFTADPSSRSKPLQTKSHRQLRMTPLESMLFRSMITCCLLTEDVKFVMLVI